YTVEASLAGFKTVIRTGIVLDVADVRAQDVQLEAGALSETVTVQSPAVAIQTIGGKGGPRDRRAGPGAPAQRSQLPAARDADAGCQPGRHVQYERPRAHVGHRAC